ncbi:MAG TPA: bifunctional 2-C-methyl-D-erythritol 4-phosphate cytidylyltransferase/2-C-methyl-D-erythritol 2,4-cyclodiphosphate synthase [Candidatus Sulfotelmatobacter sp.]|nr:bifunctional 2-C-methyl-D-erythritol 4-phosphate cytidylyltransferase/2-C-methyl-D-erythritol 2,4-cyclodiphosphate synthase [Candidatus Sulfotelmatobacter sp.]
MTAAPSPASSPTVALIVAAGRGRRFGEALPKQYQDLLGRPVLRHTASAFLAHPRIGRVRVVIGADDTALYRDAVGDLDLLAPVIGGAERQDSVRLGLESLLDQAPEIVLIHDAARPLVDAALITRSLDALARYDGAIAAVPVIDTVKRADGDAIVDTIDRTGLWRAQTPQTFRFRAILEAHRAAAGGNLSDDAAVAARAGLAVGVSLGDEANLKITTQDDLARAERLMTARLGAPRVGNGFDVHRFGPGDHVTLCGVKVAHGNGLLGHSDADVGLHALTDAILGALGDGDIGQHFSPNDPRWRNADSSMFLADAARRVADRGGRIAHVDVTLICERPKIAPHRVAMVTRIAEILRIPASRVSVKATTTEGLGFTGRSEGIAGQATATVLLPD